MSSIVSLGYRTDLMLLTLQGSEVEEHDDYLVVRTPANPTFRWGNFILFRMPPASGELAAWVDTFSREFPDSEHLAIGIDSADRAEVAAAEARDAGLAINEDTVMTTDAAHGPQRSNRDAVFRLLDGERDWAAAVRLKEENNTDEPPDEYRAFAERNLAAMRQLQEDGHGGWFGAFADGQMVSGLGIFSDGSGIARFQSVDTHPEYRNRGLAGTLVHHASQYAVNELEAQTLVMVADPEYAAIRLYRSLGFADTETQVQLERPPTRLSRPHAQSTTR